MSASHANAICGRSRGWPLSQRQGWPLYAPMRLPMGFIGSRVSVLFIS